MKDSQSTAGEGVPVCYAGDARASTPAQAPSGNRQCRTVSPEAYLQRGAPLVSVGASGLPIPIAIAHCASDAICECVIVADHA
jgi:hypothetical protein